VSFLLDTVPPVVTITSPALNLTTAGNITIIGRATDDRSGIAKVEAQIDGGPLAPLAFDSQGNFQLPTNFPLDGSAKGPHTVRIRATDKAGNVGDFASLTFTLGAHTLAVDCHLAPDHNLP